MDAPQILQTIEATSFANWLRESLYAFPIVESFHVLGLTLVFGTIAVLDLRMLGLASTRRPFSAVRADMLRWTWLAFALTVTTGLMMFTTDAVRYFGNTFFRLKMAAIALAGINMLVFELTAGRQALRWDKDAAAPRAGKIAAVLSIALWIGVIFFGRWIGFTMEAQSAPQMEEEIDFDDLFQ